MQGGRGVQGGGRGLGAGKGQTPARNLWVGGGGQIQAWGRALSQNAGGGVRRVFVPGGARPWAEDARWGEWEGQVLGPGAGEAGGVASAPGFAVTVRQHPLGAAGRGHLSLWNFLGWGSHKGAVEDPQEPRLHRPFAPQPCTVQVA